jgi:ribosomal-protein-alanine N-acetyltransferase
MNLEYTTNRLILRVLDASAAKEVLTFFDRNRDVFEPYEPLKPQNFYTLSYQRSMLHCETQLFSKLQLVRFWVFTKENPHQIIGTVSFQDFKKGAFQSCQTGYRFDAQFWNHGYAAEALSFCAQLMFRELSVHRIFAYVMPENAPSIRLLTKLHFQQEGLLRRCINICGEWTDHYYFSLLKEDFTPIS